MPATILFIGSEVGAEESDGYRLIRELVDVRIADKAIEIFTGGQRIACHARAPNRRGHTTIADHMPSAHRRYGK